jgi:uncharacterized protein YggE
MSGSTSQPNFNSVVASLQHTPRDTGLNLERLDRLSDYWEAVREHYRPFDTAPRTGSAEVYLHEMPGGQYTNLKEQASSMGMSHRWPEIARTYAEVNQLFGDIVKVTPSSKVVGDLALFLFSRGIKPADVDSASVNVNPEFIWAPNSGERRLQGYLVERRVRVRLTELDKLGPLLERSMRAGANQIAPPRFDHSRKDALRREVMTEATRDANRNAEAAAAGVGMKPGRALQIQVLDDDAIGIMAPRVMMRAAAVEDGAAEESYQPGEIGFKVKVTATFELVP